MTSAIVSATIFSPESAWTGCDLHRVAEKRDLAKTYLGHTFRSEKKPDSREIACMSSFGVHRVRVYLGQRIA